MGSLYSLFEENPGKEFTIEEISNTLDLVPKKFKIQLRRLVKRDKILNPKHGIYKIKK